MNSIHEDGHALIKLSEQIEGAPQIEAESHKDKKPKKPTPPPSVQRQDTDYDVKPSIKKPKPTPRKAQSAFQQARSWQQFHAEAPDTGIAVQATQMGESEGQVNHDAMQNHVQILRVLCG
ncbi:hypothetical protein [Stenotrophobium rhamnosiphilum]|uniref:Uncharacterized protein n=1 Tax=Stenotrophobium rhamnosiphilum TaxID=2029166 RepID=A0A2T5MD41_9GAMM|nr:hypothetical protein [Stenotrophobium rhamnosiphilum]PTU30486.1 hypothetical protein CJD38_13290 [Stenotrophobium rhamnosiphilum]